MVKISTSASVRRFVSKLSLAVSCGVATSVSHAQQLPIHSETHRLNVASPVLANGLSNGTQHEPNTDLQLRLDELEQIVRQQHAVIQQQQLSIESLGTTLDDRLAIQPDLHNQTLTGSEPESAPAASAFPKAKVGGQYRLMYNSNNFSFHQPQLTDAQDSETFFNQRFRTWLTIQTSENIRGYLQAEMGHILWGNDDLDFPKTYSVAPPRDRAGVELRYGYLEYENQNVGLWRAGIQGWNDPYGQVLASADWDFSVGGLLWEYAATEDVKFHSGIFQLAENDVQFADDAYLLISDMEVVVDPCRKWGVSAFYLQDKGGYSYPTVVGYDSSWDVWLGARATQDLGFGALNGFAIYNGGARRDSVALPQYSHDGIALKLELAHVEVGPGKWSTQALYSSGNKDPGGNHSGEFRTIAQSARDNFGSQGYWSYLIISSPHGPSDVDDLGVSLQNRGLGLFTLQSKYEIELSERWTTISSAGWIQSDAPNLVSNSRDMGTELVQALRYTFGPGLATDFGGAVMFTGDFYSVAANGTAPDDIYEIFSRVQLDF